MRSSFVLLLSAQTSKSGHLGLDPIFKQHGQAEQTEIESRQNRDDADWETWCFWHNWHASGVQFAYPAKTLLVFLDSALLMEDWFLSCPPFFVKCTLFLAVLIYASVTSVLDYCSILDMGLTVKTLWKPPLACHAAACLLTESHHFGLIIPILKRLHWLTTCFQIKLSVVVLNFKAAYGLRSCFPEGSPLPI